MSDEGQGRSYPIDHAQYKVAPIKIYPQYICTAVTILVPPSQSNDIAKKSAFKQKWGHESTTGIHLIDE